ncbi:MAG TPA: beta-propeller fold lactonase family protein [Candidatus Nanoarchaeia archaeon]|nr:beta-propeller fold lactonase family protein [Candidatus Nanoarchaeia archaeon]
MNPANASVAAGVTQQFTAVATYTDAHTATLTNATWASSQTSVATVNSSGLATTLTQGTTVISATSGGVTGSVTLTVTAPELTAIQVNPANPSIALGRNQQFAATGTYTDNQTRALTNVTWTSSDTSVATVDGSGLAHSTHTGTTTITATLGTISAGTVLTVSAPVLDAIAITPDIVNVKLGKVQQFTATGTYSDGSTRDLTADVQWSSSDPVTVTLASSTARKGSALAAAAGAADVTATLDSVRATSHVTVVAPVPQFAYVSAIGGGALSMFAVDANTGALRPRGYTPSDAFPYAVTATPDGKFILSAEDSAPQISVYRADDLNGRLTPVEGNPFPGGSAWHIAVHPSGKFVYEANDNGLFAYTINPETGALSAAEGSPYLNGTDQWAFFMAVDPLGRFLFVTDGDSKLYGFSINQSTGALAPLPNSPYTLPGNPETVTVEPFGQFVYVAWTSTEIGAISAFAIDHSTGELTPVAASPFACSGGCTSVAAHPNGRLLFAASESPGEIETFTIDAQTGALTGVNGANVAAGEDTEWIEIEPSGKFLYAVNSDSSDISIYSIDAAAGTLTPAGNVSTQTGPQHMTFISGDVPVVYVPTFAVVYEVRNDVGPSYSMFAIDAATGALTLMPDTGSGGPMSVKKAAEPGLKQRTSKVQRPMPDAPPAAKSMESGMAPRRRQQKSERHEVSK